MIRSGTASRRFEPPALVAPPADDADPPTRPRVAAAVLLAGSVRPSRLRKASGRCGLELPVGSRRSVLDCWLDELVGHVEAFGVDRLPVRVMIDRMTRLGTVQGADERLLVSIEQDPSEFRGTAGLLHDLAKGYDDDEFLLVGHASQLLFLPLAQQTEAMARTDADFVMACASDGSPAGLMLIRCGCLRDISGVGFVDLNEQALPAIAACNDVRVVRYDQPTTGSVRTRTAYIDTLRRLHRNNAGLLGEEPGLAEDWRPSFGIVESGCHVEGEAVIHDSVVLNGARVSRDAVLVRSLVCAGAVVGPGQSVIDQVVDGGMRGLGIGMSD